MWNEVIACYWEYKVIRHVNRYVQENKGEKNLYVTFIFQRKNNLLVNCFLIFFYNKFSHFTCLILLFKFSKQEDLRIFWVSKSRNPNKKRPLNSGIDDTIQTKMLHII